MEFNLYITEKFIALLQIYMAAILDKYEDILEVGSELRKIKNLRDVQLKFVLVIKDAKDEKWLAGLMAELKARLLQVRKIRGLEVVVLSEQLAK